MKKTVVRKNASKSIKPVHFHVGLSLLLCVALVASYLIPPEKTRAGVASMLKDINSGGDSTPENLIAINGTLFFSANDGTNGAELWASDGTADGTTLVKNIRAGATGSSPAYFASSSGALFLQATVDNTIGSGLWKSDGTTNGTVNLSGGFEWFENKYMTEASGIVYFQCYSAATGNELCKSDGTEVGTALLKDITVGGSNSDPMYFENVNGVIYFQASGADGTDIYTSNGTEGGTVVVSSTHLSTGDFTNVGGTLYFAGSEVNFGNELFKTDGTADGTVIVSDILSGVGSSNPTNITNVNGTVFFASDDDGTYANELWKSDGTGPGTVMVKDINTGGNASSPANFFANGSTLYFSATDGTNGVELWKSDGTSNGTVMVKDINTTGDSTPANFVLMNGIVYFTATDGVNGVELWQTDGTSGGTVQVQDINSAGDSTPTSLTSMGGKLYFAATDGTNGIELWSYDPDAVSNVSPKSTISETPTQAVDGSGLITATTTLFDSDDDTSSFNVDYSLDGGSTWASSTLGTILSYTAGTPATTTSGINTITGASATNTIAYTWMSLADSVTSTALAMLRITPNDGTVNGPSAESAIFSIDNTAPATPSGLAFTLSATSVTLTWDEVSGASTYTVISTASPELSTGITVTYKTFTSLTPNIENLFQVRAHDAFGNISSYTASSSYTLVVGTGGGGVGSGGGGGSSGSLPSVAPIESAPPVVTPPIEVPAGETPVPNSAEPATPASPSTDNGSEPAIPAVPAVPPAKPVSPPSPYKVPPSTGLFQENIFLGSYGPDVSKLQIILKDIGFFQYPTITGYFGRYTWRAVRAYQKANKIVPTGIVGSKTRTFLNGLLEQLGE